MKVVTVGGATLDVFLHCKDTDFISITQKNMITRYLLFQSEAKIEIDHIMYLTGGGATNSAISFKRLGFDTVICLCTIGSDEAGKIVLADLKKEGVEFKYITQSPAHETGQSFIISSQQDDHTVFAYRGANSFLTFNQSSLDAITTANQLYITSLSNQAAQLLPSLVEHAKQHQVKVAINPGISQLTPEGAFTLKQSLPLIDIFILNYSEAKTFMITLVESNHSYKEAFACNPAEPSSCTTPLVDENPYLLENPIPYENLFFSIKNFFKEVLKMGPGIVIITNGSNGVYLATKEKILFHPSVKVVVENTVGAGDAFGSCFVGSLLLGSKLEDALRHGIINSASVLSFQGAKQGLLTHEQISRKATELDQNLLKEFTF